MKFNKLISLSLLFTSLLSACTSPLGNSESEFNPSENESILDSESESEGEVESEEIDTTDYSELLTNVLNHLKYNSHELVSEEILKVLRPNDKYAVDIYQKYVNEYGYFYKEGTDEVSKSERLYTEKADLIKGTSDLEERTLRKTQGAKSTYYKNSNDGTAYIKTINIQNEVVTQTLAYQDSETGTFTPVLYDDEFINPFDFIAIRDLTYVKKDNIVIINNDKATFISTVYKAIGLNLISKAYLTLDENHLPTGIIFETPDLVEEAYTRVTEYKVTFTNLDSNYYDVVPFTHSNPALEVALKELEGLTNYTYYKNITSNTGVNRFISAFYTEDMIYFHNGTIEDGDVYKGDNYDYVAKKGDDGVYYCYDCTSVDGITYNWNIIMASETEPLCYTKYTDMAPNFDIISPNLFKDIGNNKYECEESVLPTIGQYFDYGVWGVDTFALETSTNKCVISLNSDNKIESIEVGFRMENAQYTITFTYDNIGTTSIPSWLEFPY